MIEETNSSRASIAETPPPRGGGHSRTATDEPPSITLVKALAEAKGVSPTELDNPLYDTVDPEALDELVDSTDDGTGLRLLFELEGYQATVTASGDVELEKLP
jgi:hypothetical protein